jgi:hypothetical protein
VYENVPPAGADVVVVVVVTPPGDVKNPVELTVVLDVLVVPHSVNELA